MSLSKQAKILTETQQRAVLSYLASGRHAERNTVMFLLSVDAGLRAKEIAALQWQMLTDASGSLTDTIRLQDRASKGRSGGVVYISSRLRKAMEMLAHGAGGNGDQVSVWRANVSTGRHELVLPIVQVYGFPGVFVSFWAQNGDHALGAEDNVGRWLAARRPSLSASQQHCYDAALY